MWRKKSIHLVTRSITNDVFCVVSKGDSQGRNTVGKNGVFPTQGGKSELLLFAGGFLLCFFFF